MSKPMRTWSNYAKRESSALPHLVPAHTMQLLNGGRDDYLLARLGLHNGLFSGFLAAHQAAEKYLKAFILAQPSVLSIQQLKRELKTRGPKIEGLPATHNLQTLYEYAISAGAGHFGPRTDILEHLNWWYVQRYPDNPYADGGSSTDRLGDVDHLMFGIWDWFEAVNEFAYLSHGLSYPFFVAVERPSLDFASHLLQQLCNRNQPAQEFAHKNSWRIAALFV